MIREIEANDQRDFEGLLLPEEVKTLTLHDDPVHFVDAVAGVYTRYGTTATGGPVLGPPWRPKARCPLRLSNHDHHASSPGV